MKKVTFIALTFAAIAAVFTSCSKTDTTPPSVTFGNVDSIVVTMNAGAADTSVTFSGTVTDDTEIKSIVALNNGTQIGKVATIDNKTSQPFSFKVTGIKAVAGTIAITVTATDASDNIDSKDFKIVVKLNTPVAAALNSVTMTADNGAATIGAGGSTFGSYVDLDGGVIYHTAIVAAHASAIDAVFNLTTLYDKGTGFTSTNCKFGTTTLTATTFATAKADALTGLTASLTEIALVQGQVIYFVTGAGKAGLILVKTLTPETAAGKNDATLVIEVKIKA